MWRQWHDAATAAAAAAATTALPSNGRVLIATKDVMTQRQPATQQRGKRNYSVDGASKALPKLADENASDQSGKDIFVFRNLSVVFLSH